MDDTIKIKFIYRGEVPFKSISEAVFSIEDALVHANKKLLNRILNRYPSTSTPEISSSDLEVLFDCFYIPEISISTAFLGSWGLTGKIAVGIFGAFMFFEVQGTATYEAIKEEAHEQIDHFTLDLCERIEDNSQGLQDFSVNAYRVADGICVEFKEKLSEKILDSEEIFHVDYILKLGKLENDPEDVHSLRRVLGEIGHDVDSTGIFDISLEMAIQELQRSANIAPDGKVGPLTINALKEAVTNAINDR